MDDGRNGSQLDVGVVDVDGIIVGIRSGHHGQDDFDCCIDGGDKQLRLRQDHVAFVESLREGVRTLL